MVQTAGYKEADIPKQWKPFWDFWGEVQKKLRAKGERVYGLGITYSVEATDTWQEFYHFMEAYRVRVIGRRRQTAGQRPEGPPGADHRLGRFHPPLQSQERPARGHQLEGHRQQPELQQPADGDDHEPHPFHTRVLFRQGQEAYNNKIKTLRWPTAPDGKPLTLRVSIHNGFIPKDSKNKELAKDFVRFILEPENLDQFVKASNGAFFPVLKNPAKIRSSLPRTRTGRRCIRTSPRPRPAPTTRYINRKFITVHTENLYGRACGRVLADNWTSDKAVDELIARMKQIVTD